MDRKKNQRRPVPMATANKDLKLDQVNKPVSAVSNASTSINTNSSSEQEVKKDLTPDVLASDSAVVKDLSIAIKKEIKAESPIKIPTYDEALNASANDKPINPIKPIKQTVSTESSKSLDKPKVESKPSQFKASTDHPEKKDKKDNMDSKGLDEEKSIEASFGVLQIFGLICIIALAVGGYVLWKKIETQTLNFKGLQTQIQANKGSLDELNTSVKATVSGQKVLKETLNSTKSEITNTLNLAKSELEEIVDSKIDTLSKSQKDVNVAIKNIQDSQNMIQDEQFKIKKELSTVTQHDPNYWIISEARYLIRVASNKLWVEHDPIAAVQLLNSAKERIKEVESPLVSQVVAVIDMDIKDVQDIKVLDQSGTYKQIDSIINSLSDLVPPQFAAQLSKDPTKKINDNINDWRSNLQSSFKNFLQDFIVIRKSTADITPLLEPKQQWYLVENIKNKLMQAQTALQHNDQTSYKQSLATASAWVSEYFDIKNAKTKAVIESLGMLQNNKFEDIKIKELRSSKILFNELAPRVTQEIGS